MITVSNNHPALPLNCFKPNEILFQVAVVDQDPKRQELEDGHGHGGS